MGDSCEWIEAVIRRLGSTLPHHPGNQLSVTSCDQLLEQTVECVVGLSQQDFSSVISGLASLLQELIKSHPPASAKEKQVDSYCAVLNCLQKCLAKVRYRRCEGSLQNEELHCLQPLYQRITQLSLLPKETENAQRLSSAANVVLYHLSGLHFHGIFNKIILRVTSWNRVTPLTASTQPGASTTSGQAEAPETDDLHVIGLIPHLNLDAARLQQILQVIVTSFKDLRKHKQLFVSIPPILHTSIWKFIEGYPRHFNDLLKNGYPSLERSADKLFNLCVEFAADNTRKKIQIMPLQNTVLILCPTILKDITETGIDRSSPKHKSQRNFVSSIMKGLFSGNKSLCEAATVCAVDLFKAGSFVGDRSSSFFRYFVTQVQGQLHNLLFSPQNLFLHQPSSQQAGIPTFSDKDLMVTCLVAQFRTNHRNSHIFHVCLDPDSPPVFRLAFVEALQIVLQKENKAVTWWPGNDAVYMYAPNLRAVFESVLPLLRRYDVTSPNLVNDVKVYLQNSQVAASLLQAKSKNERKQLVEMITNYQLMRGLIRLFKLDPMLAFSSLRESDRDRLGECRQFMIGLVGLVQHSSLPHLPLNASEVLLSLHQPNNIELWDPQDHMTAFWDISGQVTLSIALKLFIRKTVNPVQLLEWMKQILYHRTQFLRKRQVELSQLNSCKVLQQMYTMLETVLLLFLRNTNIDAVRLAMSCFKYLVLEAELVMSPTDPSMIPYAPNLMSYKQLEELSQLPQIGRAAQQKKIRAILKGLVHTPGSALAWEDTYSSWRVTKAILVSYTRPKEEGPPPDILRLADSFPRNIMRRVNTAVGPYQGSSKQEQQLNEDNLQAEMLTWSNMTGFLCSLAGVSTKPSPSTYSLLLLTGGAATGGIGMIDGDVPPAGGGGGGGGGAPSMSINQTSPIKDPIHVRVKRSSSYHGGRPRSVTHVGPPSRGSTAIVGHHHSESTVNMSRMAAASDGSISEDDKPTRTSQTEAFVSELMHLLRCDNEAVGVQIRETVKELISYELSPAVYPYLFECMMTESGKAFAPDGSVLISESNTALIDQLVSIVQHVLETKVEGALEHLVHVKIDDIVLNLIIYVHNLETSEHSLTIRIKVCHLLEIVMQRFQDLSFRAEVQFRNQVSEYLTKWITGKVCTEENSSHMESLLNDLDLSALRAIGLVMSSLVLQSKYKSSDVSEGKSKLFLKYFTSFMNLINSLNQVDWTKVGPIHKQPLMRHVASLREYTIQAVSNMLTANIDSGLTHAIGLGYNDDLKTRTSFMEVLTSILQQGAEFNSLADTALGDRYNHMLDLITTKTPEGDFPIMMALVSSTPPESMDELAEALVLLFDYRNELALFLIRVFKTEVEALESGRVDTLFRGNSIACKVLSLSFKTFGLYYLQSVVRPLIIQLMKCNDKDFEVDPARLTDPEKLQRNQLNLLELVQTFYTTILSSLPSLPLQLRTVCHILFTVVAEHFPDSAVDTVNSAIFLRFINPAIVSPHSYNLIQTEVPSIVRRGLTNISKVLQNLANHVLFKKEAHMEVFNVFLRENFDRSRQLAIDMSSAGPFFDGEAVEYIAFVKETYKHRLHSLLWNNQEKIGTFSGSTRTYVSSRPLFQELNMLLAYLGAPTYRRKRTLANAHSTLIGSQLEEFLDSMANECDEKTLKNIKAKEIFYQSGQSKAGHPVFYFIARKFRGDQSHTSYKLLYHVMTLLKNCTEKAFELVIDLTHTTSLNEPDLELMVKFAAYVPELVASSIETVYFYNPNMAFKQCAGKLASTIRIFSHIKGSKRVVMVDSLSQFAEFIETSELNLPSSTVAFEEEGKVEFTGVHFLMFKQVALQIPVTLHVCGCGLMISLVDMFKVFEIPTNLKEMHHISDIREVFVEDKRSVAVRLLDGGQMLKFTSLKAETIFKEISTVISKWQNEKPSRFMSERKLEPKDVPGTFLNVALLNLGSTDSGLRTAAYKLLSAVKKAFKLRIDRHLESTHDLCIPTNSAQFVISVSEELAGNEPHLTLEFLSEVVAGFQQHSPALKQLCLAYMSPWLPNLSRFSARSESPSEVEKVTKLIDLLVALTISEEEMYPLIQAHVWAKIGKEKDLLRRVLASFIRMGIANGLGSRKVEVLADTVVTLEQGTEGLVATEVIKKLLKTVAHTSDHVTNQLEKHYLWAELTVLARFLLALSFNNKIDVSKNLADVFYLCVLMMAYGPAFTRATIHGIIINTVQSVGSLPEVLANEEALKRVSLKLVEFSDPKFFMQFGIPNPPSVTAYLHQSHSHAAGRHSLSELGKDALSSQAVISVTEHLFDILESCSELYEDCKWVKRWQRLSRRTSFFYNPALQSRSFLMLGVISQSDSASTLLITKTLKVLEETMLRHEGDVVLLEAIIICLTRLVPQLDENTKLNQHLFWVAVGILQLGEATLYAAGLGLMEACIKVLTNIEAFEEQNLEEIMQPTRDAMEWPLSQMDREVGISFGSNFHFALSALLFKGFSHPLSTVRTRAQELLTTVFFLHSSEGCLSTKIEVNQVNLAYLTALFPESEIVREQLSERRMRLKSFAASSNDSMLAGDEESQQYHSLLSVQVIPTQKLQILFLLMLAAALVNTQDDNRIKLLYEFLAEACEVYSEVFPLIHAVLVEHMTQMLQQSQSTSILRSVQKLISVAVERSTTSSLIRPTYVADIGFGGLVAFFGPFPLKHHIIGPTPQGAIFQKYLSSLLAELSPTNRSPDHHRVGSLSKISSSSSVSSSSMKDYLPITSSPSAALLSRRGLSTGSMGALGGGMKPAASNCSLGSMGEKVMAISGSSRSRETSPCILGGYDTLSMDELDITDSGDAEETAL